MKSSLRSLFCLLLLFPVGYTLNAQVVINEFMAGNGSTISDFEGHFPDYIELYNDGSAAANLTGLHLTDDPADPFKWPLPPTILIPGGYQLIFASNKDTVIGNEWHTNFSIQLLGEPLHFTDLNGVILDSMPAVQLGGDQSYGRFEDGDTLLAYLDIPSPGSTNTSSGVIRISHPRGFYNAPFDLELTSIFPGDSIFYTLDGSTPTVNSQVYTTPIPISDPSDNPNIYSEIQTAPPMGDLHPKGWKPPQGVVDKCAVVRCVAYRNGTPVSRVQTYSYFINEHISTKYPIPVISLVTDPNYLFDPDSGIYCPGVTYNDTLPFSSGNYFQRGPEWERPVHVEFFEREGEAAMHQDAGMRISGNWTRSVGQKSLRLYARQEYGSKHFEYAALLQKEKSQYKRLLLRTTFGSRTDDVFKDAMLQHSARRLGMEMQDYRPVVVFMDGEYWGMHTVRDVLDEFHLAEKYDLPSDSIDIVHSTLVADAGSADDFLNLLDFVAQNDLTIQANYDVVDSWIDIDNFIDYHITQLYFGNVDWPTSNMRMWRSQRVGSKWRWLLFDLDASCMSTWDPSVERFREGDFPDSPVIILRKLLKHDGFRKTFLDRFAFHISYTFSIERMEELIDKFHDHYWHEMDTHIERWSFPASQEDWSSRVNDLRYYVRNRPCLMRYHLIDQFNLLEFDYPCVPAAKSEEMALYPNPSEGNFIMHIPEQNRFTGSISVTTMTGQRVWKKEYYNAVSLVTLELDELHAGIYVLTWSDETRSISRRFIVK
jgi:hypothetical protein